MRTIDVMERYPIGLNKLSVTIPDLRRSCDMVKIIHGKTGQDQFTRAARAAMREDVIH